MPYLDSETFPAGPLEQFLRAPWILLSNEVRPYAATTTLISGMHAFYFIRNYFIRSIHVDGQNIKSTYALTEKTNGTFNLKTFIIASSQEVGRRLHSFAAATQGNRSIFSSEGTENERQVLTGTWK